MVRKITRTKNSLPPIARESVPYANVAPISRVIVEFIGMKKKRPGLGPP
jgi:hypothetical protein